tara:strand:- start:36 stop:569 length:534 start_codon:yes stop_codon:yes gene_type:complete
MAIPIPGYGVCGEDDAAVDADAAPSEKAARHYGAHVFVCPTCSVGVANGDWSSIDGMYDSTQQDACDQHHEAVTCRVEALGHLPYIGPAEHGEYECAICDGAFEGEHNLFATAKRRYTVIVGNVGTVYDGADKQRAWKVFFEYMKISQQGVGRAGNEPVTLCIDGEPFNKHIPEEVS